MPFTIFRPDCPFVLKCNALHENFGALSSAKIMRINASAASIIDVRDMMIEMAINITMTDRQTPPLATKIDGDGQPQVDAQPRHFEDFGAVPTPRSSRFGCARCCASMKQGVIHFRRQETERLAKYIKTYIIRL